MASVLALNGLRSRLKECTSLSELAGIVTPVDDILMSLIADWLKAGQNEGKAELRADDLWNYLARTLSGEDMEYAKWGPGMVCTTRGSLPYFALYLCPHLHGVAHVDLGQGLIQVQPVVAAGDKPVCSPTNAAHTEVTPTRS